MTAGRTTDSQSTHWCTPLKYADASQKVLGEIALDPCSNEWSIVQAGIKYCLPAKDGLKESWDYPTIYVNPPYGRNKENGTTIKDWLARCALAHQKHGSHVIALVPVATNTRHWKEHVFGQASVVCFLADTRLRFLINGMDTGKGAPMACAMIYWGGNINIFRDVFTVHGAIVYL